MLMLYCGIHYKSNAKIAKPLNFDIRLRFIITLKILSFVIHSNHSKFVDLIPIYNQTTIKFNRTFQFKIKSYRYFG